MNAKTMLLTLVLSLFGAGAAWAADTTPESDLKLSLQPGPDSAITMKIKESLANRQLPATRISVMTINGVVTLAGELDNPAEVQKSIAIARATPGVRSVDAGALISRQ